MEGISVGQAATRSGWSARMLRYLEQAGLVVPARSASGYRLYGIRELNQLSGLADLRRRFGVELERGRVRTEASPRLRPSAPRSRRGSPGTNVPLAGSSAPAWVEWEQRKHERLLVA